MSILTRNEIPSITDLRSMPPDDVRHLAKRHGESCKLSLTPQLADYHFWLDILGLILQIASCAVHSSSCSPRAEPSDAANCPTRCGLMIGSWRSGWRRYISLFSLLQKPSSYLALFYCTHTPCHAPTAVPPYSDSSLFPINPHLL